MNRSALSAALLLLAMVLMACSSDAASPSATESEAEATEEASAEPTEEASKAASEPAATEGSSTGGALAALLPDEVAGLSRTDIPGMEAIIGSALAEAGTDASGAEYVFASYGDAGRTVVVTAIRVPGMDEPSLQALARAMAGADPSSEVSAEPTTVGGKEVLEMGGEGAPSAAYLYFADGAVFTVVSEDAELAAQLLAELP